MIGADIFNTLYEAMPAARATLRSGSYTAARCLCVSATKTGQSSEQGLFAAGDATVRMLLADDAPGDGFAIGKRVEVALASGTVQTYRIAARVITADVLRLVLEGITD